MSSLARQTTPAAGPGQGSVALLLTGRDLDVAGLAAIARDMRPVALAPEALQRLIAGRAVVENKLAAGEPVYGLTTGLGSRVTHRLDRDDLAAFALRTVRGRANGVGPALPRDVVRALLAVRLNGLLNGGAGVTPALAERLAALLNAGLHPRVPSVGSIGASDLCLLAHVGLALVGEGELEFEGRELPAAEALRLAGLAPFELAAKEGLAICSASSVSVGIAGLALHDAGQLWRLAQLAAALSFEGFRANLTPFDPRIAAARPAPGQVESAAHLRALLADGELPAPGAARRLQDPVSLRAVAAVHGSLLAALRFLAPALEAEINGAGDNPLVLIDDGEILSSGNFHTPALALALDALSQALAQVAALSVARAAKLLTGRFTGLPDALSPRGAGHSGLAPLLKVAEALLQEIRHAAQPAVPDLRWSADGVEDDITNAPLAAKKAAEAVWRLRLILAIELTVAAQTVELRAPARLASAPAAALAAIRDIVPALDDDRPLGAEVEALCETLLIDGSLLKRCGAPILPA